MISRINGVEFTELSLKWSIYLVLKITEPFPFTVDHVRNLYILSLHNALVYPGLHPMSQCPVCLLQGESLRQLPLQLWTQSLPYVPNTHSTTMNRLLSFIKTKESTLFYLILSNCKNIMQIWKQSLMHLLICLDLNYVNRC